MDVPLAVEASLPSVTGKALEDKDTPQLPYLPGTKWSRSRQFQAVGSAATKAPGPHCYWASYRNGVSSGFQG